jgi:hypothetical protein
VMERIARREPNPQVPKARRGSEAKGSPSLKMKKKRNKL